MVTKSHLLCPSQGTLQPSADVGWPPSPSQPWGPGLSSATALAVTRSSRWDPNAGRHRLGPTIPGPRTRHWPFRTGSGGQRQGTQLLLSPPSTGPPPPVTASTCWELLSLPGDSQRAGSGAGGQAAGPQALGSSPQTAQLGLSTGRWQVAPFTRLPAGPGLCPQRTDQHIGGLRSSGPSSKETQLTKTCSRRRCPPLPAPFREPQRGRTDRYLS